jgi:hypothetical protein
MDTETRIVEMQVVGVDSSLPRFTFDMQSRVNQARTVRFSIDQHDAQAMYTALAKYLNVK